MFGRYIVLIQFIFLSLLSALGTSATIAIFFKADTFIRWYAIWYPMSQMFIAVFSGILACPNFVYRKTAIGLIIGINLLPIPLILIYVYIEQTYLFVFEIIFPTSLTLLSRWILWGYFRETIPARIDDVCAICLEPVKLESVAPLDCPHTFHQVCISQMVRFNTQENPQYVFRCPTCRQPSEV